MSALFACSKCFSRHPFEELSSGQQLCKECRGAFPLVKCTYCRTEFQQTNSKGSPSAICKKCEGNVKQFGKPSACEYCNIIAVFIGTKCQRCTNSEKKYGPPVTCEQCKQKCAFDRKDEDKKVDGKLLCWLCTLSFKRALAKTKQTDAERRAHLKLVALRNAKDKHKSHNKRPHRVDVTKMNNPPPTQDDVESIPPNKVKKNAGADIHDPNSSDHVVAMTQLREQIASLQKQLGQKDSQLLTKDKQITELKAKHFTVENELRNKMKTTQKDHDSKVEMLHVKIKNLQKEVATLSKSTKRQNLAAREASGTGSGSGTDSPSLA
ncbi:hypothetical protein PR048_029127 [Dryococelus australis]|uniref:Protein FAM76A n=1 Tax=Dryococelus australis TaxID=614101 RepID=A0ABQ9GCH4_9NEOP|nr:hypothetical protein PR048_029127 [Dryococelus australis]